MVNFFFEELQYEIRLNNFCNGFKIIRLQLKLSFIGATILIELKYDLSLTFNSMAKSFLSVYKAIPLNPTGFPSFGLTFL